MVSFKRSIVETIEVLVIAVINLILPKIQSQINRCIQCSKDLSENNRFCYSHIKEAINNLTGEKIYEKVLQELKDTETDPFFLVKTLLTFHYISAWYTLPHVPQLVFRLLRKHFPHRGIQ